MPTFRKVRLASNLGPYEFYQLAGLPDGETCNVMPEDDFNRSGPWFVTAKRGGKKKVIRCKSLADAKAAAAKWASARPAKRKVTR